MDSNKSHQMNIEGYSYSEKSAFIDPIVAETARKIQDRFNNGLKPSTRKINKTLLAKRARSVRKLRRLAEKVKTNLADELLIAKQIELKNNRPRAKRIKTNPGSELHQKVNLQELLETMKTMQANSAEARPAFVDGSKMPNLRLIQQKLATNVTANLLEIKILLEVAPNEELPHVERLIPTSLALAKSIEEILQELRKLKEEGELQSGLSQQTLNTI